MSKPKNDEYAPSLLKATEDSFEYALKLTTGEVIFFAEAIIYGNYIRLIGVKDFITDKREIDAGRGLDVRADQIVWCVDAPEGS
jgi:hypothetical protein